MLVISSILEVKGRSYNSTRVVTMSQNDPLLVYIPTMPVTLNNNTTQKTVV
jgi:hypothetical protein